MASGKTAITRERVSGTATGLVLMTIFTLAWAIIADIGLQGRDHHLVLIGFGIITTLFVMAALGLYSRLRDFAKMEGEAAIAEERKRGKWFGIVFGAEGLGILIAINIVTNIGHPELVIPSIALIVGLHFYPMAWIFKRTVDHYLASWSTLVAISGIIFSLCKTFDQHGIFAFVGIGTAMATFGYGIYMLFYGLRLIKERSNML